MNAPTSHRDDIDAELAERLRRHLEHATDGLPAPAGAHRAVHRARARRQRRRTVAACAAAVALVAGVVQLRTGEPDRSDVATSPDAGLDPSLRLEWSATDGGLTFGASSTAAPDVLYAISTAAGTRMDDFPDGDAPRSVYRLGEDGTWAEVALAGDDPVAARISHRDGALYAVSTGTADARDGRPLGSVSTDGGETWTSVPLEAIEPPSDAIPWTVSYTMSMTSTTTHTLALVTVQIGMPWDELLGELEGSWWPEIGKDGIDILRPVDPEAEDSETVVDRTVTWDELGIDDADDLAPRWQAYLADGEDWIPVDIPAAGGPSTSAQLGSVGDRLALITSATDESGQTSGAVHLSNDGRTWEGSGAQPWGQGYVRATRGGLVRVEPEDPARLGVSADGQTWQDLDLRELHPSLADLPRESWVELHTGPSALVTVVHRPEGPLLAFSPDLASWTVTELGELLPEATVQLDVLVGADRVVVLAQHELRRGQPPETTTLVGVPRRS
jgi:hypothetical protein